MFDLYLSFECPHYIGVRGDRQILLKACLRLADKAFHLQGRPGAKPTPIIRGTMVDLS